MGFMVSRYVKTSGHLLTNDGSTFHVGFLLLQSVHSALIQYLAHRWSWEMGASLVAVAIGCPRGSWHERGLCEEVTNFLPFWIRYWCWVHSFQALRRRQDSQKQLAIYTAICVNLYMLSQYLHVYEIRVMAKFQIKAGLEQWSEPSCCASIL
jgi:hypothetical protein